MRDMHPATYILFFLFIISLIFNFMMAHQIEQLKHQVAPIIIRPHIRPYEMQENEILITIRYKYESTRII